MKSEKHKYEQIIGYITYSGEGERAEEGESVEGKTRDWQFAKSDEYMKFVFGIMPSGYTTSCQYIQVIRNRKQKVIIVPYNKQGINGINRTYNG